MSTRSGLWLLFGALLLGSLGVAGGLWLGRSQTSGNRLETQLLSLQEQVATGQASPAQQQQQLELLLALGRRAEASALVQQLADRAPERWELRLLLAELRRDLGDRSGAIAALRRLLTQQPDQIEALQLLALLLQEQGQGAAARQQLQSSLERLSKPKPRVEAIGVGLLLADLLDRQGSPGQAEAVLIQLATAFPTDQRPLLAKALLLQQRGQLIKAQAALAQARTLQPGQSRDLLDRVASAWGLEALKGPSPQPTAKPQTLPTGPNSP
jgi:tetratricopeptide (TPR) repeat protein